MPYIFPDTTLQKPRNHDLNLPPPPPYNNKSNLVIVTTHKAIKSMQLSLLVNFSPAHCIIYGSHLAQHRYPSWTMYNKMSWNRFIQEGGTSRCCGCGYNEDKEVVSFNCDLLCSKLIIKQLLVNTVTTKMSPSH